MVLEIRVRHKMKDTLTLSFSGDVFWLAVQEIEPQALSVSLVS